MQSRKYLVFNM
ncbi:Protein of unknown function [Pyronema omphalodes CBS 100304]|uniref:Uncharacterized protein n=1 Tax=Pyronema omphalodes (strain CBS 100304) TaxID=1076935 RepID=U4LS65_PYROM|nr:Protein of unknown function [Pyronema omphalodes CBS 100304]